jgi:hypothetical protein
MSFDFIIDYAREKNLTYQVFDFEGFFVPIGRNYFTRVRNLGIDYYIEYCDDHKQPLDDNVKVIRIRGNPPISYDKVIVNYILEHPKNKSVYIHFNKVMKKLDQEYHCTVVDNKAFLMSRDKPYFTKFIAKEDRILVEYYNERYVYLNKFTCVMNDNDIENMVKYCIEAINNHPLIKN